MAKLDLLHSPSLVAIGLSVGYEFHYALGWRAPKTATSTTPFAAVTWPRSRINTSGPDPWGLTGRAWLQAGAQQVVIAVDPSFKGLGIEPHNGNRASNGLVSQMQAPLVAYNPEPAGKLWQLCKVLYGFE